MWRSYTKYLKFSRAARLFGGPKTADLRMKSHPVRAAWSPDGAWLAWGSKDDYVAQVWGGGHVQSLYHLDSGISLSWTDAGLVSGSEDGFWRTWDCDCRPAVEVDQGRPVTSVSWRPGADEILTGCDDDVARVWSAEGEELASLPGAHPSWSPDGRSIAVVAARVLTVHDADTLELRATLGRPWDDFEWSPDGTRLAYRETRDELTVVDVASGADVRLHHHHMSESCWRHDSSMVATSEETGLTKLWDAATGSVTRYLHNPDNQVGSAWQPREGAALLALSSDCATLLWDPRARAPVRRLANRGRATGKPYWSPDGSRLALFNDRLEVYDL